MEELETTFENKCWILGDLWLNYRDSEEFTDFVEYNDLGLPLAYATAHNIIPKSDGAVPFIDEAFSLLLAGLGIDKDTGFDDLEEMLSLTE